MVRAPRATWLSLRHVVDITDSKSRQAEIGLGIVKPWLATKGPVRAHAATSYWCQASAGSIRLGRSNTTLVSPARFPIGRKNVEGTQ